MEKSWVIFSLRVPGFHRWTDAPEKYAFLANWHRHEFHIVCEIRVSKNRQIEIIDEKESLHQHLLDNFGTQGQLPEDLHAPVDFYNHLVLDNDDGSCEALASEIAHWLANIHETDTIVTVLEDGENGARAEVTYV